MPAGACEVGTSAFPDPREHPDELVVEPDDGVEDPVATVVPGLVGEEPPPPRTTTSTAATSTARTNIAAPSHHPLKPLRLGADRESSMSDT
jgi:hypothetical protein